MNKKIIFGLVVLITVISMMNVAFAHEAEYPEPYIVNPKINEVVSGDVNFNMTVDDHHETLYVNITATHKDTNTVYFHAQDSNPTDGWSCTWDTSDAPNGKYIVVADAENSKHLKGQYSILLTLNNVKKQTNIVLDSSVGIVNESNTIVAHIYGENATPLSNKNLEFTIGGETFSNVTSNDGAALISFVPKEAKEYNLTVKFAGDNVYAPSQTAMILNVLANSTLITVEEVTGNNNKSVLLKANLKNYQGLNSNRTIEFYVNGKKVGSALTDENGDAQLNYTISEIGGSYIYYAEYVDDSSKAFKALSTLYVPHSSIYVRITATTYSKDGIFTVGNDLKISYALFNEGPNAAEDVVFRYVVPDSLTYIESSASQGSIDFNSTTKELVWKLGTVEIGNQTLDVLFKAVKTAKNNLAPTVSTVTYDESVNRNTTRNIVTVNSYKLTASDLTKYFTGSEKFKFYLKDNDGKAVEGATINVVFNKNTFGLKTNKNGYVELDTKGLAVGNYVIKATCNGLSVSKKIVVKALIVAKDISKKKAKTIKFTAKLVNNKGKAVSNKKLTFKFKGKTYTAKTNKNGIAAVSLKNLKVGKYTIETSYGKSSVKNKITIKK